MQQKETMEKESSIYIAETSAVEMALDRPDYKMNLLMESLKEISLFQKLQREDEVGLDQLTISVQGQVSCNLKRL